MKPTYLWDETSLWLFDFPKFEGKDFVQKNRFRSAFQQEMINRIFDQQVIISYDEKGKPSVAQCKGFSISHTKDYLAVLTSPNSNVGVDIERPREKWRHPHPQSIYRERKSDI